MRAGGCAVQQSLTADAATVVKQAVSLAQRRGNAQVTPLHVASSMLAAPAGLLRAACLRSHSHPLQCKALELCFNVALNRLPASAAVASSPLLGGHGHHHHYYAPSLSNALVAAFKRAQAHQRRGSAESQQQPVLAVKIELEQLVVSILDDPSVSRVMREAGFSSTQVKANVEQAVCSTAATAATATPNQNPNPRSIGTASPPQETKAKRPLDQVRDEDVAAILDCLASQRKRRVVVVAESTTTVEALARAAVDKIKRGEAKHDALRGVQVVSLRVSSFRDMPKEEAERRLAELRCLVKGRGKVLLVVEDLKWVAEFWAGHVQSGRRGYYCAIEHVVTEVRALSCAGGREHGLCWLVGFGTYQAYMKCRAGEPSLESMWGLQTLTVPAGSLALSLTCAFDDSALGTLNQSMKASSDTDGNGPASCWPLLGGSQLISRCCGDCSASRIDTKAALPRPFVSSSSLPSWLQHCRDQEPTHLTDLGKTWSSIFSKPSERMTLHFSAPVSPVSSISSYEHGHQLHQPRQSWLPADLEAKHPWKPKCETSGKAKSHDSGASNGSVEVECRAKFKELNAENLKVLCGALEKEVPRQKEIVPEIASTVLQCRSGIAKRRDKSRSTDAKEETWMFFLGGDAEGKEMVARELANLVFGSRKNFMSIRFGASSPSSSGSSEEQWSKRPRTSPAGELAYLERLYEAISENPHRVILLEDVEQADRNCTLSIKEAIESGVVRNHAGDEVGVADAIIILSCESFDARSRACSPPTKRMKVEMNEAKEEQTSDHEHNEAGASSSSPCFDLNVNVESDQADERNFGDVCLLTAVDRTLFFRRRENL
ncbi:protein SMAX1-LIKE 3-like [Phragmites australis]|uniref:protein SMAX1-LIKE 3-like n=1 Tax=Phragmites australis TaxID=29695 RepID=UPI002D79328C|nr:protein SMAX1-LIKE 3-like [Phragmites australis]